MSDSSARRVTLNDVAQLAGVSHQTVSRVINDHPHVADATRSRVLKAIAKLDYRPNKAAKSLVTQRSETLAVISYGLDYYGPSQMLINIEHAAREAGYDLIFTSLSETTVDAFRSAIDHLAGWQVDGIIAITPVMGASCEELQDLCGRTPLVQIDTQLGLEAPSVVIDQGHGTRLVTQHLIDLGHRRICEISGPLNWYGAAARHEQWLHTLQRAGLAPIASMEGDWSTRSGYESAKQLLEAGTDFTALVVANDLMALGAMRALREAGLRVPEDVSVVGFDNMPQTEYFEPPLTTIWQDFNKLGQHGIEMLIKRLTNPDAPIKQRVVHPVLVERASTTRPRT